MKKLFNEIREWQEKTFPESTVAAKINHLKEEVQELSDCVSEIDEMFSAGEEITLIESKVVDFELELADCFFLLFGTAGKAGYEYEDLIDIIETKLSINKAREWGEPDCNGVVHHTKAEWDAEKNECGKSGANADCMNLSKESV